MLPLIFISLAFTLALSSASQLCSSLPNPSHLSSQSLAFFSQECIILPHQGDDLHIQIPLLFADSSHNLIASVVDTNGEVTQFIIEKDPQDPSQYILKSISKEKTQEFPLSQTDNNLLFIKIRAEILSLSLQNHPFEISHALRKSSQYIFTIKAPPIKPTKPHSPRFLSSCPEDYFLVEDACVKVCPALHYGEDGQCKECSEACGTSCLSLTQCNPCEKHQFYFKEADTCLPQCPEAYFHDTNNKICVKCAEGCLSCTFPDGLCNTNYFKTATLVNLLFSSLLFLLIVLCTCCLNKSKNRQSNPQVNSSQSISEQPKQEGQETNAKIPEENPQIIMEKPKGPYVVLNEDPEGQEANEEFDDGEFQDKTRKKRLSNVGRSRLLSISMSKPFIIDDGNEEKAISHDSSTKLYANSPTLPNSRLDSSPGGQARRKRRTLLDNRDESKLFLKSLLLNEDPLSRNLHYNHSTDASPKISFRDASPLSTLRPKNYLQGESPSPVNTNFVRRETSFGTMIRQYEQAEKVEKGEIFSREETVPVEEKEEEMERSRKMSDNEEESKGYKQDLSTSVSQDRDGVFDRTACSICGLNKRDCVNQPCGDLVACFPCMKQFKESYGLCPKCKRLLNDIEKINVQH